MTPNDVSMDANVDSTQVNDMGSVPSQNVKSVSEMDDYNDFMSEEEGLSTSTASMVDDYDDVGIDKEIETYNQQAEKPETQQNEELSPEEMGFKERSAFFQSQYDTALNENQRLKQQLEMLQGGLQNTPDNIREEVIRSLQGNQQTQEQQTPQAPEAPQMPQMPKDFDQYEAVSDPSSESAKYLKANQDYQQNLIKYQNDLVQYNIDMKMNEFKQEQMQIAQQEQVRIQQTQQRMKMENDLVTMGMSKEMHSEFGQWLNSAESIKPIVNMFMRMKQGAQQPPNARNTQLSRNRMMPRNSGVTINNASQPMSEQQSFNMGRKGQMLDDY